ncbi:MAG: hypothetical protein JW800_08295, partial [Candidatus Omnitrophica bacterium]|nr:hypothetical protein [Candidatus Omnitrophota bacterium]
IGLPWYIVMLKLHGDKYMSHIFLVETLKRLFYAPNNERGFSFMVVYFKRILYYVPVVIIWFAPHSLFLPAAIFDAFKSKNTYSREKDSYKLILSYFFGIFVFFSLVSIKEYHYMLPLAPACALIISRYLVNLEEKQIQFKSISFKAIYFSITVIYAVVIAGLLYTMMHIYPNEVHIYEYLVLLAPLILIVPYVKRSGKGALIAMPVAMAIFLAFLVGRAIPLLNDNALGIMAQEIQEDLKEEDRVGVGSVNISQQRLSIYLDRNIEEVNIKWRAPEAVPIHISRIEKFVKSGDNIYLVMSKEDYENIVPDSLKPELRIIDRRVTWKTRLKRSFSKEVILQILKGEEDILKDVLRHEMYLLTNKKN